MKLITRGEVNPTIKDILDLILSIGTKMLVRDCGGHTLSSIFTGGPDTSVGCMCDTDAAPDPVNC